MVALDDNPAKTTVPISQPLGLLLALMGVFIPIILFVGLRAWYRTENVFFNAHVVGGSIEEANARLAELLRPCGMRSREATAYILCVATYGVILLARKTTPFGKESARSTQPFIDFERDH